MPVILSALILTAGCISTAESTGPDNSAPYTIEEYSENELTGEEDTYGLSMEETPVITPTPVPTNPYSTEKEESGESMHDELLILIDNSTEDLLPLSDKLKYGFTSKSAVERLKKAAENIKDIAISQRKELMRLTLSEDFLVAKLKYKHFLDTYDDNSDKIIKYCEKMVDSKTYGRDNEYDKDIRDYIEDRTDEYDDADESLYEAAELAEKAVNDLSESS